MVCDIVFVRRQVFQKKPRSLRYRLYVKLYTQLVCVIVQQLVSQFETDAESNHTITRPILLLM